jgi:hypothetical protein
MSRYLPAYKPPRAPRASRALRLDFDVVDATSVAFPGWLAHLRAAGYSLRAMPQPWRDQCRMALGTRRIALLG